MTGTHKISRWKSFKNHLNISQLAAKSGYVSSRIAGYIDSIEDEPERNRLKQKFEVINAEDRRFNGDDGSNENLERYIMIVEQYKQLKSELASIRKN